MAAPSTANVDEVNTMRGPVLCAILVATGLGSLSSGCGDPDEPGGLYEPCTTTTDCEEHLTCMADPEYKMTLCTLSCDPGDEIQVRACVTATTDVCGSGCCFVTDELPQDRGRGFCAPYPVNYCTELECDDGT